MKFFAAFLLACLIPVGAAAPITLTWDAPTDGPPPDRYYIYACPPAGGVCVHVAGTFAPITSITLTLNDQIDHCAFVSASSIVNGIRRQSVPSNLLCWGPDYTPTPTPTATPTPTPTPTPAHYRLTMIAGSGGRVTPGTTMEISGRDVSITATPNTGHSFSGWTGTGTGAYSGTNNPASVTMNSDIAETATFTTP
jgi:hypothetical protein